MWPLIILGLAVGGYFVYSKSHPSVAAGSTDAEIQKTANFALQNEKDPNVLKTLALKLDAAGYHDLASKLSARADQLAHSQGLVPANQVFTLGQMATANQPIISAPPPPVQATTNIAPSLGTSYTPTYKVTHVASGPNGYPPPAPPHPYVSITVPVRR
jgi:hypothetical protein